MDEVVIMLEIMPIMKMTKTRPWSWSDGSAGRVHIRQAQGSEFGPQNPHKNPVIVACFQFQSEGAETV